MKQLSWIKLSEIVIGIFLLAWLAASVAYGDQNRTSAQEAAESTRACTLATGNATQVTAAVGSSAATAALDRNEVYLIRCTTETYIASGTSAPTAGTGNFAFPAGVFPLRTTDTVRYLGFRAVATPGTCYVQACN